MFVVQYSHHEFEPHDFQLKRSFFLIVETSEAKKPGKAARSCAALPFIPPPTAPFLLPLFFSLSPLSLPPLSSTLVVTDSLRTHSRSRGDGEREPIVSSLTSPVTGIGNPANDESWSFLGTFIVCSETISANMCLRWCGWSLCFLWMASLHSAPRNFPAVTPQSLSTSLSRGVLLLKDSKSISLLSRLFSSISSSLSFSLSSLFLLYFFSDLILGKVSLFLSHKNFYHPPSEISANEKESCHRWTSESFLKMMVLMMRTFLDHLLVPDTFPNTFHELAHSSHLGGNYSLSPGHWGAENEETCPVAHPVADGVWTGPLFPALWPLIRFPDDCWPPPFALCRQVPKHTPCPTIPRELLSRE